jgi:hypothetical protein
MPVTFAGQRAFVLVRTCVRNSPWVAIAVMLHVLLLAIFSVLYFTRGERREPEHEFGIAIAQPEPVLAPIDELDVPKLDRDALPVIADAIPGPVYDGPDVDLTALPGAPGETSVVTNPDGAPGDYNPDPEALPELSSGDPGGTPIGVDHIGHRGLRTSAFSTRKLGPGGPGGGGPGNGGTHGPGGAPPERMKTSTLAALRWLARHQSPDGSWDSDGFAAQCKNGECGGAGSSANDAGLTGLALLCFLGADFTPSKPSEFRQNVADAIRYLCSVQDSDGCFGPRIGHVFLYNHACAALAMAEAYGMTNLPLLREPAQRGVNFVHKAQNPYGAWRYSYPPDGDNDTSVTGWMVMVLKSAKLSRITIDDQALQNALNWIDQMTDPATGRTGYTDSGGLSSRLTELMARFPAERSEAMTAVGVLTRILAGRTQDDPMIERGADLLAAKLPQWDEASGAIDFYYWYYGSLAMFQVGGAHWDRWSAAMQSAILEHQQLEADACEFGSWEPIDPWSASGGRIYATAMNCLCMEVFYRYERVFGVRRK